MSEEYQTTEQDMDVPDSAPRYLRTRTSLLSLDNYEDFTVCLYSEYKQGVRGAPAINASLDAYVLVGHLPLGLMLRLPPSALATSLLAGRPLCMFNNEEDAIQALTLIADNPGAAIIDVSSLEGSLPVTPDANLGKMPRSIRLDVPLPNAQPTYTQSAQNIGNEQAPMLAGLAGASLGNYRAGMLRQVQQALLNHQGLSAENRATLRGLMQEIGNDNQHDSEQNAEASP